jgi:hypothetical protein
MLDGAGDADREVELRRDDLAGLADLVVIRDETGVDRSTAGTERRTELVGERFEQLLVVLATAQTTAAGDDDLGGAEFGAFGFGQFAMLVSVLCAVSAAGLMLSIFAVFPASTASKAVVRTVMTLTVGTLHGSQRVAGVDRADEGVGGLRRR